MKYFLLQLKKLGKFSPFVLGVFCFFAITLCLIIWGILDKNQKNPNQQKIKVGVVAESDFAQYGMGINILESMDEISQILEFELMSKSAAKTALEKGDIGAYLVFPAGFVDAIFSGDVKPVDFVTNYGAGGLVLMLKEELTKGVSTLLEEAQKGVYGIQFLLDDNGFYRYSYKYLNEMNLEYISIILDRDSFYELKEIGISKGLNIVEYIICGLVIFALFLFALPFCVVFIKKDYSINQLLKERELSPFRQILLENLAFFLFFFSFLIVLLIVIFVPVSKIFSSFLSVVFALIPLVILIVCFAKFIFEVSGNLLNGSLLYFFSTLILCYFGGCFYPISTFPEFFQNIASWLPSGIALNYGASLLKGKTIVPELFGLLGYSVAFLAFTIFYRQLKIKEQI